MQVERSVGESGFEKPIMRLVPMSSIADDGVPQVPQVQPNLMVPTGGRVTFYDSETARRVPGDGSVPFKMRQRGKRGVGRLGKLIVTRGQRLYCRTGVFHPATNNRPIFLFRGMAGELFMEHAVSLRVF